MVVVVTVNALIAETVDRTDGIANLDALQEVGIDQANDPNFISDEEISKKLSGTNKKLKEWLSNVNEGYILDRIYDVAMGMNLSVDKIKTLKEKMPNKDFIGE